MKNKSRAKKKAAGDTGELSIKFDPKARHSYLTGFRKRKQARRWKAHEEMLQKERQDRIDIKKEHREEVRKAWRDYQRAAALTNKALGQLCDDGESAKHMPLEDAPGDYDDDEEHDQREQARPVTVAFDREEDDPFGDCEVTTTSFEAPSSSGGLAANAAKLWPALLHTNISSSWASGSRGTWDPEDSVADEAAAVKFAKQRRRAVVKKEEENRAHAALQRRVEKRLGFKKKSKKGKAKADSGGKKCGTKTTHGARRRAAKKASKR